MWARVHFFFSRFFWNRFEVERGHTPTHTHWVCQPVRSDPADASATWLRSLTWTLIGCAAHGVRQSAEGKSATRCPPPQPEMALALSAASGPSVHLSVRLSVCVSACTIKLNGQQCLSPMLVFYFCLLCVAAWLLPEHA